MGGVAAAGRAVSDTWLREGGGVMYAHKGEGGHKKQERQTRENCTSGSLHACSISTDPCKRAETRGLTIAISVSELRPQGS